MIIEPSLAIFSAAELPVWLKHQLLAAVRIEWWWVFQGDSALWDYTAKPTLPRYVVLTAGEVLLSFAELNRRTLAHAGETYQVDGMSAVYTFPAVRRQGYGGRVVTAATAALDAGDGDVALLFCLPERTPFYARLGWEPMQRTVITGPTDVKLPVRDEVALGRPRTAKGGRLADSHGPPLDVGPFTW